MAPHLPLRGLRACIGALLVLLAGCFDSPPNGSLGDMSVPAPGGSADNPTPGDPLLPGTVGAVPPEDFDGDGYSRDEDCDDNDPDVNPGEEEVPYDGKDNDCDPTTPDDDLDGDGLGQADDCDDNDPLVGGDEDSDEDGVLDCLDPDDDGDGDPDEADCAPLDSTIYTGADEHCDGVDEDCDGTVDNEPLDGTEYFPDTDCDGFGDPLNPVVACEQPDGFVSTGGDCDDLDPGALPGGTEICDGVDNNCDSAADEDCSTVILVDSPSAGALDPDDVEGAAACGRFGELNGAPDPHNLANLDTYESMLDGTTAGLTEATELASTVLDHSTRCGGNLLAAPGNYSGSTTAWPSFASTGNFGAMRMRGYLNIACGESLDRTIGLIGNDSLDLVIEGQLIIAVNWADGQWKKFRWIHFPEPGLYAFEVRWSTNLHCAIDPFELVLADDFVAGYQAYDTMCSWTPCGAFDNGVPIPGLTPIDDSILVKATDGSDPVCLQCGADGDCPGGQVCNSAGLCQ